MRSSERGAGERKRLGQWATPPALVDHLVELALPPASSGIRVLDPACGDGRFLAAVARRVPDARLFGADLDEDAVVTARAAVPGASVRTVDALRHDWGAMHFDLVIGNPPFLSQLAASTTRRDGSLADSAVRFVELGLRIADRVALVLPQSVIATRDVEPLRRDAPVLRHLWWGGAERFFDAQVLVCALVIDRSGAQTLVRRTGPWFQPLTALPRPDATSWSPLVADLLGMPGLPPDVDRWPTLGSLGVTATAGFRDEFYGLVGKVADDGEGAPLVTTGLVDAAVTHWGLRSTRFAGQRFDAPRVIGELPKRMHNAMSPKVIVATQTPTIEAFVDSEGSYVASVPLISATGGDLWTLCAALLHPVASVWALTQTAGAALALGTVKLAARQVLKIPVAEGIRPDLVKAAHHDPARRRELLREAGASAPADIVDWWFGRLR
jgi:predicted RNA methylase